jgi:hypothetical protein
MRDVGKRRDTLCEGGTRRVRSKTVRDSIKNWVIALTRSASLQGPPQMQRLSTLMWQPVDLGRPEEPVSRFTATRGSLSLLPLLGS